MSNTETKVKISIKFPNRIYFIVIANFMLIPIFIKDSNLPARVFVPCSVAFSWSISTCIGPSLCKPGERPRAAIASVISTRPAVQRERERESKVFEQRWYHSITTYSSRDRISNIFMTCYYTFLTFSLIPFWSYLGKVS